MTGKALAVRESAHVVDSTWRITRATALEATANSVAACLDHVDDVEQSLGDAARFDKVVEAGRGYAAQLRSVLTELDGEARKLREAAP